MSTKAPRRRASWHDAYDSQMSLWQWYRTEAGHNFLLEHARHNIGLVEREDTQRLLLSQYAAEEWRLLSCDPIFVSAEMCEVIEAAHPSFEPEPLLETDLLTTRGFLLYETPFPVLDRWERETTIAGVSWTRMFTAEDKEAADAVQKLIDTSSDSTTAAALDEEVATAPGVTPVGISLTIYGWAAREKEIFPDEFPDYPMPRLIPLHLTPWYFDMTFDGNEVTEDGFPSGAEWWWRILQTTLRLMQQRIAVKHVLRPDRAARREAKKLGGDEHSEVVVVRLRREQSEEKEPTGEEANYSHRFIVSGHWRNQWYPSAEVHRQIWISPYVKGPEGMPLIVRPRRVYTWDR